ncbi:MAG: esterase family protein, partial [Verrucomicrobiales bacterium]|nr:esterase family protein [Verrucomicrobiales bacterium]
GTAYLPHQGQNFENWIVQDVPKAAALAAGCISEHSAIFIAGLSMGGFGAMRLGCKYQNKFRGISAHSAITNLNQLAELVEEPITSYNSPDVQWRVLDLMKGGSQFMPPLRFDCGLADPLLEANRELHRQLDLRGIHHIYEEFEGGHDWLYWENHLRDTLRFFSKLF